VAQEHFISMYKRGWHARYPIEVLALKLPKIAPSRGARLPKFNKNSILIAPHRRKSSLNQQVRSSSGLKWAAYMIAKVHDVANAEGSYVREYGFKCRTIPVYVRDCSKLHLAPPIRDGRRRQDAGVAGAAYHIRNRRCGRASQQKQAAEGRSEAATQQPRPISYLGRETPAHADTWFNRVPGFLIEPNDGRVGLDDLQIDLDAAESRSTPFSFCKQRLSNPFALMGL
jgi:hypothetical protein